MAKSTKSPKPRRYLRPPKSAHRKLSLAEIKKAIAAVKAERENRSRASSNVKQQGSASRAKSRRKSPVYLDPPKSAHRKLSDEIIERSVAEVIAERHEAP